MNSIVANHIHMGADVGSMVVIGISAEFMRLAINAVISDDAMRLIVKAPDPLLLCGGMFSPPVSIFL
jgi:hypothetical protein